MQTCMFLYSCIFMAWLQSMRTHWALFTHCTLLCTAWVWLLHEVSSGERAYSNPDQVSCLITVEVSKTRYAIVPHPRSHTKWPLLGLMPLLCAWSLWHSCLQLSGTTYAGNFRCQPSAGHQTQASWPATCPAEQPFLGRGRLWLSECSPEHDRQKECVCSCKVETVLK